MDDDFLDLNLADATYGDDQTSTKKLLEELQKPSETRLASAASTLSDADNPIYVLPKTYNGKTVTELFPEFHHDSVLRYSKLFGVGKQTSLPKIWRGTRKRKKPKQHQLTINTMNRNLFQNQISEMGENTSDAFKIFDNDNSQMSNPPQTTFTQFQTILSREDRLPSIQEKADNEQSNSNDINNNNKNEKEGEQFDDLEFETDDEV
jgi:hypothetical protein